MMMRISTTARATTNGNSKRSQKGEILIPTEQSTTPSSHHFRRPRCYLETQCHSYQVPDEATANARGVSAPGLDSVRVKAMSRQMDHGEGNGRKC
jgi:hypothetical protein